MIGVEPVEIAAAAIGQLLERDAAVIVAVGALEAALLAGARVGGGRLAGPAGGGRRAGGFGRGVAEPDWRPRSGRRPSR